MRCIACYIAINRLHLHRNRDKHYYRKIKDYISVYWHRQPVQSAVASPVAFRAFTSLRCLISVFVFSSGMVNKYDDDDDRDTSPCIIGPNGTSNNKATLPPT